MRALLLLLAACSTEWNVPHTPGVLLGEQYCEAYNLDCGHVYEFAAPADNPLGHVELCVLDEDLSAAETEYGPARLTSRFEGENLCYWHCDGGKGCNAYNSCYCPEGL